MLLSGCHGSPTAQWIRRRAHPTRLRTPAGTTVWFPMISIPAASRTVGGSAGPPPGVFCAEVGVVMGSWPRRISAITLFVEDLPAAMRFYQDVFGFPVGYQDESSAVFDFGNTII